MPHENPKRPTVPARRPPGPSPAPVSDARETDGASGSKGNLIVTIIVAIVALVAAILLGRHIANRVRSVNEGFTSGDRDPGASTPVPAR